MLIKQSSPFISLLILIVTINVSKFALAIDDTVTSAAGADNPILELYMHDILGGSNPTARPITGLLGNIYSGQVPFARPVGFIPPKNGVAIPTVNGIPLGTGLAGTTFAGNPNSQNANDRNGAQLGPDGLGLGFGTITVIDDMITYGPDLGS
ncbi:hypothetical protein BVC80_9099g15 [Macleaya cordata]|uniref:Dirigent protein n=1 Tax=Macleaya cordata TaxID=56857 RepID=A0A200PVI3_MACCD|nr:hypothetical protein BVC80_9099g15 [Macleaya cordata]